MALGSEESERPKFEGKVRDPLRSILYSFDQAGCLESGLQWFNLNLSELSSARQFPLLPKDSCTGVL